MHGSGGQNISELTAAKYIQHPFQVVNHRCQTDLCLGSGETTQQEARMSEDTVLYRGERMFHRGSSQAHHFRSGSLLHALQGSLMQVPRNVTAWA
jgi:hypothetical protein